LTPIEGLIDGIIYKITVEKAMELASYQPRFIVDQVVATCRFLGDDPHFEPRFIEYALNNLKVKRHSLPAQPSPVAAPTSEELDVARRA
jgi:hypothetical protein